MEKIVLNLLSNAMRFSPQNGWVKIKVHFSKNLIIEIGNNGEIIPPTEQPKIFERFYQAIEIVEANLDNSDFTIENFAKKMLLSRMHLHRKLKTIIGLSPSEFIRNLRLERAAQLLESEADSVSQIAFQVGFNNLSYFAKCFKEKYDCAPSVYKSLKIK